MGESLTARIAGLDWAALEGSLNGLGYAVTPALLASDECRALAELYPRDELFRKSVDLARFRFGRGRYRYFSDPLPPAVAELREALYPPLAEIANRWAELLRLGERFPSRLSEYRLRCESRGQVYPTPLLLDYESGDYNCLHQDLYGELAFPLQCTCLLSRPETDFDGGEFLLLESRPRMQSRAEVVALRQGAMVLFPNCERPVAGARGHYRVRVRHGVSRVRRGHRRTLGIIFHDAR